MHVAFEYGHPLGGDRVRMSGRRAFSSNLEPPGPPRIPPSALGQLRLSALLGPVGPKNVAKSVLNALCCGLPTSYATYTACQPDFQTIFFKFPTFQISKINAFNREGRYFSGFPPFPFQSSFRPLLGLFWDHSVILFGTFPATLGSSWVLLAPLGSSSWLLITLLGQFRAPSLLQEVPGRLKIQQGGG